ncbi:MAG: sterol desaturase family protein [Leptolyngbyaceae cyanobacterium]
MSIDTVGYYYWVFLGFILGRYFLFAGGTFGVVYLLSKLSVGKRFGTPSYRWRLIRHDIFLSVSSAFLFALIAALVMVAYQAGNTRIYSSVGDYGWAYLGFSFCAILVLQDSYFYATHRLLHHPVLFKYLHKGHHRSRLPTPWTSFAFEPGEALIHGLFFVGLVFVLPLHFVTLTAAFLVMTLWAIATHLQFALVTPNSALSWLGRGLIGPTHHGLHHRRYQSHFGLYFTFWDRLLGTTDHAYLQTPALDSR